MDRYTPVGASLDKKWGIGRKSIQRASTQAYEHQRAIFLKVVVSIIAKSDVQYEASALAKGGDITGDAAGNYSHNLP